MTGWHAAHLIALGAWAGLVAGEVVLELAGRRRPDLGPAVALFHRWIDLVVEIPILVLVAGTGVALLSRVSLDATLVLKAVLGLGAIGVNLACAVAVHLRARAVVAGGPEPTAASVATAEEMTGWVFRSVYAGVPLALAALVMGLHRAGWV